MEATVADEMADPPHRIYSRLRNIAGYTWDESKDPFHSSYDNWYDPLYSYFNSGELTDGRQVFGTKDLVHKQSNGTTDSERNSPHPENQHQNHLAYRNTVSESGSELSGSQDFHDESSEPRTAVNVVARISTHALREERAYHICKNLIRKVALARQQGSNDAAQKNADDCTGWSSDGCPSH